MVSVVTSALKKDAAQLERQVRVFNAEIARLSKIILRLSQSSDFDEPLRKLHLMRKKLELQTYQLAQLARTASLAAEAYEKADREVYYTIENDLMIRRTVSIKEVQIMNPAPFIRIV